MQPFRHCSEEVEKLIEAKAQGQKIQPGAPKSNVIDLVAALQESVGSVKKNKNAPQLNIAL